MRSAFTGGILAVFLVLSLNINDKVLGLKNSRQEKVEYMPRFSYYTLDGKTFSNRQLAENKSYLFVYFSPLCGLCKEETEALVDHIDAMKGVQIVMVSPGEKSDIKKFVAFYKLKEYPQITVLHDPKDSFYLEFGAIGYPNLYVYDKEKKLVQYFDQVTDFYTIERALQEGVISEN